MISKFDSLYAGHVDMEDVGYGGTAVNDRWFSDEHLATAADKATAMARLMDGLGYDTLWLAEHHFQREGFECIPNIMMLGVHLAHLTKELKIGCGFNVTPMWHPLRLAEDFATVDYLTGGRLTFGVGRGYHSREVETFGAPVMDQAANRELFEEQVEIIFKAFNERAFSHRGKHYTLPANVPYRDYELKELTLVPRPLNRPVECWQPIVSANPRGFDFMAKHGIKGLIGGGISEGGARFNVIEEWRDALGRTGREAELGEDLAVGFHFYLSESREQGIREASKYFEENLKSFGPLRVGSPMTDQQIRDLSDPNRAPYADLPSMEGAVNSGSFLCGTPEEVIEDLMGREARMPGLERVNVAHPVGMPQSVILEQLERFAEEVMPAFTNRTTVAAADGG